MLNQNISQLIIMIVAGTLGLNIISIGLWVISNTVPFSEIQSFVFILSIVFIIGLTLLVIDTILDKKKGRV